MKTKKWIFPVCIVVGIIVLCLAALLITAGVMSAKGYGISIGKLYFADIGTYLIDGDDKAMLVSDQSEDGNLFKKYSNGDKVLVIHDGVEESYPSRTGGYYAVRLSRGDVTYKPANEVLGIEYFGDGDEIPALDFAVQYIRTDGYHEDVEYPVVKIIRSVDELNAYYDANKEKYDLERKEKLYSDTTIGFLDACDKYDEAYFEDQILVMVMLEEGSGSNRHEVQSVSKATDGTYYVNIDTVVPEVGTCDMAEWHILIEPEAGTVIDSESDVTVLIDGVNRHAQSKRAQHSRGYANIFLNIPDGWEYETEDEDGGNDFCIAFWPTGESEGKIRVWYYEAFGVCGTGLEEEKITLGKYEAYKGTYDNNKVWDFISLIGTPGQYVVMNDGATVWWDEYGVEAILILNTLVVGDGIINEAEAIKIAEKEVNMYYNAVWANYDADNGLWTVVFGKKNTLGGCQEFTITHEGKIINIEYGE